MRPLHSHIIHPIHYMWISSARRATQKSNRIMENINLCDCKDVIIDDESIIIETDLTDDERAIIKKGMAEYRADPNSFIPLDEVD